MTWFRLFLAGWLVVITAYTSITVANHGLNLLPIFFGDIARMAWPGQFNLDFMGFLSLSALWVAWRHQFSPAGLGLGLLAFFLGMPFLSAYLLVHSVRTRGAIAALMLGETRASQL